MGRLAHHPVKELKKIYSLETMIETGTEHGYGVEDAIRAGFQNILSCEIMKYKFDYSYNRFSDNRCVKLFCGSSEMTLETMIKSARGNILFWLDAHLPYKEGKRQSDKETDIEIVFPMLKELNIISQKSHQTDVIIIDDAILFIEEFRKEKFSNFDLKRFSNKDETIDISFALLRSMFPKYEFYLCEKERGSLIMLPCLADLKKIIEKYSWRKLNV